MEEKDLNRFRDAHKEDYKNALAEIKNGRKLSHWMWYIFPQIKGLGESYYSIYYSIDSLEEAVNYLNDEILGAHLLEITGVLLELNTNDPVSVLGSIDSIKLRSSMTLFYYVSNNEIFKKVIDKFYDGKFDNLTVDICEEMKNYYKLKKNV